MRVCSYVLGHLSTNLRTLLLTQSDSRERKERITKSFIGSWENTDRPKNQSYHRMYYRALWEKKKYHLTKSENNLQNSDNLLQLKSVLDILPWHRNRHPIEYHVKFDSQSVNYELFWRIFRQKILIKIWLHYDYHVCIWFANSFFKETSVFFLFRVDCR